MTFRLRHGQLHRGRGLHPHHGVQAPHRSGKARRHHHRQGVLPGLHRRPRRDAYYAIINPENDRRYAQYRTEAERFPNLHLLGRLADKSFVEVTREGRFTLYRARVREEDYRRMETNGLLRRYYKTPWRVWSPRWCRTKRLPAANWQS